MIIFGGDCCVPIALLSVPNTIVILINDVTDIKKKGNSDIADKNNINVIELLNCIGVDVSIEFKSILIGVARNILLILSGLSQLFIKT